MATTNSHVSNWGVGETKRLLPHMVDEIAYSKPETIWAEYPRSLTTYAEGFKAVTYQKFANAINGTAWWLQKTFGVPENFQTLAYIGPNDIRYQVLLIGAIKAGFKVLKMTLESTPICENGKTDLKTDVLHFSPKQHRGSQKLV